MSLHDETLGVRCRHAFAQTGRSRSPTVAVLQFAASPALAQLVTEFSAASLRRHRRGPSCLGPMATSGSPNSAGIGSARSRRPVLSPNTAPGFPRGPGPEELRLGPTTTCGSPNVYQQDRAHHAGGSGHRVRRPHGPCCARFNCRRSRRRAVVHGKQRQPDWTNHHEWRRH